MKEFKTVAFAGFEKQIRDARLTVPAMRGEVIGNFVAEAWFSTQRLVARLQTVMANRKTTLTLKQPSAARQHLTGQHRIATPH